MAKCKADNTPLACHCKHNSKECPTSDKEQDEMKQIPYVSAIGSLMYVMVCMRLAIDHVVGVVSRFLSNFGKKPKTLFWLKTK